MNLGEAKTGLSMLINTHSKRGSLIATNSPDVVDYHKKMPFFLNLAQKGIAEIKYIKRHFKASHYLPFLPSEGCFDNLAHTDKDFIVAQAGAKAYHFAVDDTADVYVEGVKPDGSIDALDNIYAYSDGGFTAFKGIIYASPDEKYASVQLRFSGGNYYNVKNIALFTAQYSDYDKIPNFSRYIEYKMPKEFARPLSIEIRKH